MCCWRRVCNHYTQCGHVLKLPEEMIRCENRWCKFSTTHPTECKDCKTTCWQYRQYPQQYAPQIDSKCPVCRGEASSHSRRR